jgi:hypothetical protein
MEILDLKHPEDEVLNSKESIIEKNSNMIELPGGIS